MTHIVHHMAALDGWPNPPNSLEAVRSCLSAGALHIEVDITALADTDYLLVHDPVLESETTGTGRVDACSSASARALRIKVRGVDTGVATPQLGDIVDAFVAHGGAARLQLDFKNVLMLPSDEPLMRLVNLIKPLGSRVIVSSGADWQLRRLRTLAPWLTLGFDIMFFIDWQAAGPDGRHPEALPQRMGAYGYWDDYPTASRRVWSTRDYLADRFALLSQMVPNARVLYCRHGFLAQSLRDGFNWAEAAASLGIDIDAWTLDMTNPVAAENARLLTKSGVGFITTNTPAAMATWLN